MTRKNIPQKMSKNDAGRLGAYARMRLHGNPGTIKGRRKGGLKSIETHKKMKTGFILRKAIHIPKPSEKLAEFIGIMLGDGHVGQYQASITTNSQTDYEHASYIKKTIRSLFATQSTLSRSRTNNSCTVVISSRSICDFLKRQGLPQGNKVRDGVRIPNWIKKRSAYTRACVRGLFDTDGSVYCDTHKVSGKEYKHLGIAFTNRNTDILSFYKESLVKFGLHPTQKTPYVVFLRRGAEIDIFFKVIGSSNRKHLRRYREFRKQ